MTLKYTMYVVIDLYAIAGAVLVIPWKRKFEITKPMLNYDRFLKKEKKYI